MKPNKKYLDAQPNITTTKNMTFGSSGSSTQDCSDPCAKPDPCATTGGSYGSGSSGSNTQDCNDPCASTGGSYGSGSNGSSQDQCVDPCAETVCPPTDCVPCVPVDPCASSCPPSSSSQQQQQPRPQPVPASVSSGVNVTAKPMSAIIGGSVSTCAGNMVNGKFVPLSASPKKFKASAKPEVSGIGASIGAKSSRVTAQDLLKPSGFMSELKTSSKSPTAFAERVKARRAARASKSAELMESLATPSAASDVAEDMCNSCGGGKYGTDKKDKKEDRGFDSGSDSDSDEESDGF